MFAARPLYPAQRTNAKASPNVCDGPQADAGGAINVSASSVKLGLRIGPDIVNRKIGAATFLFGREPDTNGKFERAVNNDSSREAKGGARQRADKLRGERHAAEAAQHLQPKDAACDSAP